MSGLIERPVPPPEIEAAIREAFPHTRERSDFLVVSELGGGEEPGLTWTAFADRLSWTELDWGWLDGAPDGYATALSFLSDKALCFFIPAYLIADLNNALERVDPLFHLIYGFADPYRDVREQQKRRWSSLNAQQARAIVMYLEYRAIDDWFGGTDDAKQALSTFWYERAAAAL